MAQREGPWRLNGGDLCRLNGGDLCGLNAGALCGLNAGGLWRAFTSPRARLTVHQGTQIEVRRPTVTSV